MKVADIILEARRVLGDTSSQHWTPERMIDIFNRGMRDIARHGNMYRKETIVELSKGRTRYPLPPDILKITSISNQNIDLPILSRADRPTSTYASKDQLNLGILEIQPAPTEKRKPMQFDGKVGAITAVSSTTGVASSPVHSLFGVTSSLTMSFDESNTARYGIITGVARRGEKQLIHYKNIGSSHGVITGINQSTPSAPDEGGVGQHVDKYRIVGKYGFPTVALNSVLIRYKALPPKIITESQEFPLSPQWEDLMVDWIIGTALADDNDAGNQQRSVVFIQRYIRNLEAATADSAVAYADGSSSVKYLGSITSNSNRKRRRR